MSDTCSDLTKYVGNFGTVEKRLEFIVDQYIKNSENKIKNNFDDYDSRITADIINIFCGFGLLNNSFKLHNKILPILQKLKQFHKNTEDLVDLLEEKRCAEEQKQTAEKRLREVTEKLEKLNK